MMQRNKDWFWPWVLGAGILLVVGGLGLYFLRGNTPEPEPVADVPAPVVAAPVTPPPAVVDTSPPPARTLPLPPLDESDADVVGGLTELFGQGAIAQHLVPERVVRNIVVTIDNVPRSLMALEQRPLNPTPGDFITSPACASRPL